MRLPHLHWFREVKTLGSWCYQECRCGTRRVRAVLASQEYVPMDVAWVEKRAEVVDPFGAVDESLQVDPRHHRTIGLEEMLTRVKESPSWPNR